MMILFLPLLLLSVSTVSVAQENPVCSSKLAASYASAIANIQYPKRFFNVMSAKEVTEAYFKEAKIKKHEPVEIYAVSLKSSDQWECLYYVTLNRQCEFQAVSFHHCAK